MSVIRDFTEYDGGLEWWESKFITQVVLLANDGYSYADRFGVPVLCLHVFSDR